MRTTTKIAITSFFAATLLTPVLGYSAEAAKAMESIKENVSDAAITAKIKTEFARDKEVSALKINVDTDNKGVVTLRGTAKSQAEADKAAAIARQTKGVTSVTNDIQVSAK